MTVANGWLTVSPSGAGHELMESALKRVADSYDPYSWAGNGPELLTLLVLHLCDAYSVGGLKWFAFSVSRS